MCAQGLDPEAENVVTGPAASPTPLREPASPNSRRTSGRRPEAPRGELGACRTRRPRRPGRPRGFTLIELLVVISILVLLVSMLLPAVTRAKQITRRLLCQNNFHSMGAAGQGYAAAHNGRGPGYAHRAIPSGSSISWANILNDEFFHADTIVRMGTVPVKGKICCPDMTTWGANLNIYARPYKWNLDATGGPSWGGNPAAGPYGMELDARQINPNWDFYALGAVLARFPNPSQQFLASEGERANDSCPMGNSSPPYGVTLGDDPTHPPWAALSGQAAFRHMLPQDTKLWQARASANYLFVDGHVEAFGPNNRINASDRFAYSQ